MFDRKVKKNILYFLALYRFENSFFLEKLSFIFIFINLYLVSEVKYVLSSSGFPNGMHALSHSTTRFVYKTVSSVSLWAPHTPDDASGTRMV